MLRSALIAGVVATAAIAVATATAAGSQSLIGSYTGKATRGTTLPDNKGTKLSFDVKVVASCPVANNVFRRSLCLSWNPTISLPVACQTWNSADPTHRPTKERRAVPYSAAVSAGGHVDLTTKSSGPGYSQTTRIVVAIKNGKATGRVTYKATGRSAIANTDCSGRLEFSAKRR